MIRRHTPVGEVGDGIKVFSRQKHLKAGVNGLQTRGVIFCRQEALPHWQCHLVLLLLLVVLDRETGRLNRTIVKCLRDLIYITPVMVGIFKNSCDLKLLPSNTAKNSSENKLILISISQ